MRYSFGVLSYNQENYILELLESIKFQILRYGKSIDFFLYIADDASQDRTVVIASEWISDNSFLFKGYDILRSDYNVGTTAGYEKLLNRIDTEFFKVIAGDDVFARNDIFEELRSNNVNQAVAHMPLILKEGKLEISEYFLNSNLIHQNTKRTNKKDINNIRFGGYINTPSFFPTRNLINETCVNFMRKFTLFEDDPTWYMMLKTNRDLVIRFDTRIKVLYRIHMNSVSNSEASGKWCGDVLKLIEYYYKDSKDPILKIYLLIRFADIKRRLAGKGNGKYTLYNLVDKIRRETLKFLGKKYLNNQLMDALSEECMRNQEYYNQINKAASEKLNEIESRII